MWGSHPIGWPSISGRQVPKNKCSPSPFLRVTLRCSLHGSSEGPCRIEPGCLQWWPTHTHTSVLAFPPSILSSPCPPFRFPRITLPKKLSAYKPCSLEHPRLGKILLGTGVGLLSERVTCKVRTQRKEHLATYSHLNLYCILNYKGLWIRILFC